jgi:Glycosyl transferase family 2
MPDHVHAVLSFARDESMSEVIRDWKRFHNRSNNVRWQEGYFDHRLRLDERGAQLSAKLNYIRQNPVAAGLCAKAEDWRGKGDAVRLGFELATKDILMILDADLTTSPEELPRFYHADSYEQGGVC